jgi:bifunctional DNA-binding transcriptional regulator/antitoxin component of YhaV-PrlF toxin-antitoxin module
MAAPPEIDLIWRFYGTKYAIIDAMLTTSRISVVTERGQVSIPSGLRRELSLSRGRRLLWEKVGEDEIRVLVLPRTAPTGAQAMLGFAKKFRAPRRPAEWMEELREGER